MQHRLVWLDAIKGVGIVLIMLSHIYVFKFSEFLFAGFIPLFLISSGITFRAHNLVYLGKKLLVPYLLYSIISVIVDWFYTGDFSYYTNILGVLYGRFWLYMPGRIGENIQLLGSNRALWYLLAYFCTYWAFVFIEGAKRRKLLVFIYLLISILLENCRFLLPWSIDMCFMFGLLMLWGYNNRFLIESFSQSLKNPVLFFLFFVAYLMIVAYNGTINASVRIYGNHFYSVFFFFYIGISEFLLLSSLCISYERSKLVILFSKVGRCSLRLMCIHYPIKTIFFHIIDQSVSYSGKALVNALLILGTTFCINHFVSIVIRRYFDKVAILKYI